MSDDLQHDGETDAWPHHFPTGCPPPDAGDLNGDIFMLVATDPPTMKDAECAKDRGVFTDKPEWMRAALSVGLETESLTELRTNVKRLRFHRVAVASLSARHGKIRQTTERKTHYSMWLRERYLSQVPLLFRVIP